MDLDCGSLRTLANTQAKDDLLTIKTVFQAATTKDDPIFAKWADLHVKQGVLMAAQQRDTFANTPTADLPNNPPRTSPMYAYGIGTTGDSTFIPLREGLVAQFLANPPTITSPTRFREEPEIGRDNGGFTPESQTRQSETMRSWRPIRPYSG